MAWLDSIVFAHEFEEASGTRAPTYGSGDATESGGTVSAVAAKHNDGAEFARGGPVLVIADAVGNRLGKRDWTLDFWWTHYTNGDFHDAISKGVDLHVYWSASAFKVVIDLDNGGLSVQVANTGYVRVVHDWAAHTITIQTESGSTEYDYTWANDAVTTDWVIAGNGVGGLSGWVDELALWARAGTPGEGNQRASGVKFIDEFSLNPPVIDTGRSRMQVRIGANCSDTFDVVNDGGNATSVAFDGTSDTPAGVVLSLVGGTAHLAIDGETLAEDTYTIVINASNADGSSQWTCTLRAQTLYPSAEFTFKPYGTIQAATQLGVIADCVGGIDRVEIDVDGGTPTAVTAISVNAYHGHADYNIPFDPADVAFTPGTAVAVHAVAYPNFGEPTDLGTRYVMPDPGGTLTAARTYRVSPSGNDSNPGTAISPKLTIGGVFDQCQTDHGNLEMCVAELEEGDYDFLTGGDGAWTVGDGLPQVRPAPGADPALVRFTQSSGFYNSASQPRIDIHECRIGAFILNANNAQSPLIVLSGNTRLTGPGRDAVEPGNAPKTLRNVWISYGTWTGGRYAFGDPCVASAYQSTGPDDEQWENESQNYVIMEDNSDGFGGFTFLCNVLVRRIAQAYCSPMCSGLGMKGDYIHADGTDDGSGPPPASGNPLHSDIWQSFVEAGHRNLINWYGEFYHCQASFLQASPFTEPEFIPATGYYFREILGLPLEGNGLFISMLRSVMGVGFYHVTATTGNVTRFNNDAGAYAGQQIATCIEIKNSLLGSLIFTSMNWSTRPGELRDAVDHIDINGLGSISSPADQDDPNGLGNLDPDTIAVDPAIDDWRVLPGGPTDGTVPRLAAVAYSMNGTLRSDPTSYGAWEEIGLVPNLTNITIRSTYGKMIHAAAPNAGDPVVVVDSFDPNDWPKDMDFVVENGTVVMSGVFKSDA